VSSIIKGGWRGYRKSVKEEKGERRRGGELKWRGKREGGVDKKKRGGGEVKPMDRVGRVRGKG